MRGNHSRGAPAEPRPPVGLPLLPTPRLITERLELRPLPALAAAALPEDRQEAARILGATLPPEWPQPDLLDVLPRQAAASPDAECFGIWVMVERDSGSSSGTSASSGRPTKLARSKSATASSLAVGVADTRGSAGAIVEWARSQPDVQVIVAGCDSDNAPSIRMLERLGFRRTGEANVQIRWRYGSQLDEV